MAILQDNLKSLDYYFRGSPQADLSIVTTYDSTQNLDIYFYGSPFVANLAVFNSEVYLTAGSLLLQGSSLSVQNTIEEANTISVISGTLTYTGSTLQIQ